MRQRNYRRFALATAVAATVALPPRADAWFVLPPLVFDAQQFAQRVQDVARQAEQIARMQAQIEGELRMLAATDVSTLAGVRAGLERLRAMLARLDAAPTDAGGDLAHRYPNDWIGGPADAPRYERARDAWIAAERDAIAQARAAQNAIAIDMPAAAGRVEQLVAASNDAPGLTAALQARTQLQAELSAEIAKLQVLRDSKAFARAEREGAMQSSHAYAAATAAWLSRPGTITPVAAGGEGDYAVSPIPEPGYGGRR